MDIANKPSLGRPVHLNAKKGESLQEQIDRLVFNKAPSPVYDALAINLAKHVFCLSGSHKQMVSELKKICDIMTKTIENLNENRLVENPRIKIEVLVEENDGTYSVV